MKKLSGLFTTTPTGLKTYEIYYATSEIIPVIALMLNERFGFEPQGLLDGIDVLYLDCVRPDCRLTIGWDNWSGCFIMSFGETPEWEGILREIGSYLDTQLENLSEFFDKSLLPQDPETEE